LKTLLNGTPLIIVTQSETNALSPRMSLRDLKTCVSIQLIQFEKNYIGTSPLLKKMKDLVKLFA
jgi:hypothetical protein